MSTVPVRLTVNGQQHEVEVEPRLLLVHLLRDTLGLTGTHVGCDTTNCGACTVHLDGEAVKSCTVLAVQADGAEVKTIEGMADGDKLHPLQEAFWNDHGLQCGYCTPGMIMAAADLLAAQSRPQRGRGPQGPGGQPLPLHRLPQHRQGGARRREGGHERRRGPRRPGGVGMSATEAPREPRPATATSAASLRRKEDPRLIQGQASYVDDINLTGQLWAAWVRSPEAHAKIVSIDTSAAKARDGVVAVYTHEDLDMEAGLPMAWVPPGVEVNTPDHWVLAKGEVKHVGDPVALVIGNDRYTVVDAAEDVIVDYDPLPVVTDPEAALEDGSALVH